MTVEYIRYKVTSGERETFIQSFKTASEQLAISEYCKACELSECEEEINQFILRIEWSLTQDRLNGFKKSEVFPSFLAKTNPFEDYIQEKRNYKLM